MKLFAPIKEDTHSLFFDNILLNIENKEEEPCAGECEECKVPDSSSEYFRIENRFAELKTDLDKLIARQNLGISDEYSLIWGNIKGNIHNQTDLIEFLQNSFSLQERDFYDKIYSELQKYIDEALENFGGGGGSTTPSVQPTIYFGPDKDNLSVSRSYTFTTGDYPGHIYVYAPNANCSFKVNGFEGGFVNTGSYIIKDNERYYEYMSYNIGLGITTITVQYGHSS